MKAGFVFDDCRVSNLKSLVNSYVYSRYTVRVGHLTFDLSPPKMSLSVDVIMKILQSFKRFVHERFLDTFFTLIL